LGVRRGGGDCGSSRGEIGGRGRRGGSGSGGCCGGTGFSGQALKDGSSGCEGLIRASHCALLLEHEYIDRLKKMEEKRKVRRKKVLSCRVEAESRQREGE